MCQVKEEIDLKCFLETECNLSTTTQASLEMVVGYKNEWKFCLVYMVVDLQNYIVDECRKYVSFFNATNGDCKAVFVELSFCDGNLENILKNKYILKLCIRGGQQYGQLYKGN